ncbi:TonB-dependent receptor [Sphingosinithalassobacter tenebrarum]|uniref:TonB-dependent receptor n=2 Tax=Stakelama tenebrarum TaxID=2711215 RepID=A0A6G6Y9S7_9SPHN|nr:TonB-dependent receptor [Sphingosinithalassobacter tenebrarum]
MVGLALAAPVAAMPASAQEAEIVVTGEGLAPPPGDAAYATVTIERDRLANSASGRLEDILADVAGIAQFRRSDSRSAHPTSQGVTLRGLGGNASSRALLTLDGVPQADPFGGWVAFPAYLPERLARVRVTRGGGSGISGPGALAGTIDLTSAGPDMLGPFGGAFHYGSRNSFDAVATAALRPAGGGFVTIAGQYARGDGFQPLVPGDRGLVDHAAPYEQASLALRGVAPIGGATELQANVSGFVDRRNRGVDFVDVKSEGVDASLRLVGRGAWQWSALGYVQTRVLASGFASVSDARDSAGPALDQYNVPSTGIGARFELQPPTGAALTLRLGGDLRHVEGETRERYIFVSGDPTRQRRAGGNSVTTGGFASIGWRSGPLMLDASGRIDYWRIGRGRLIEQPMAGGPALTDIAYASRTGWEPTGRVGAALAASPAITLRAAGYLGWRLPTLNELYRPYRVGADATAANADLDPERLRGVEAGIDLRPVQGLLLSATGFWNRLDNAIANVTLGSGPGSFPGVGYVSGAGLYRQRRNLDSVEAHGAELDARWRSGPWTASASWAWTDSRVHASGAAAPLDGLRPAQVARHSASASLGWWRGAAGGAVTLRYAGPRFDDDRNVARLNDAVTLDAVLRVPIAAGIVLDLRGENLFDRRIETGISDVTERASPRTLWIGLRYAPR